jgi:hypothetical protein
MRRPLRIASPPRLGGRFWSRNIQNWRARREKHMRLQLRRLEDIWIAVQTPSRLADAVERTEKGSDIGRRVQAPRRKLWVKDRAGEEGILRIPREAV